MAKSKVMDVPIAAPRPVHGSLSMLQLALIGGGITVGLLIVGVLLGVVLSMPKKRDASPNIESSSLQESIAEPEVVTKLIETPKSPEPALPIDDPTPITPMKTGPTLVKSAVAKSSETMPMEPAPVKPAEEAVAVVKPPMLPEKKMPALDSKQVQINAAIDRGVAYLRSHPADNSGYLTGYVSLAGLALLECGSSLDDPMIQKAAQHVRGVASQIKHTYQISLAILFLDRLGQPSDRPVIQGLALRLLAGQTGYGGWSYSCPLLPTNDMVPLYKFLQSHRPETLQKLHEERRLTLAKPIVESKGLGTNDPFRRFHEQILAKPIPTTSTGPSSSFSPVTPVTKDTPAPTEEAKEPANPVLAKKPAPMKLQSLPAHLRQLPVVQMQQSKIYLTPAMDDNSNTQFALLALWVARRHEVPTEQALLLSQLRFTTTQQPDGHWTYMPPMPKSSPAMTAVGLLGVALGYGVNADLAAVRPPQTVLADPGVQKGLSYLSQTIGDNDAVRPGLYYLWSVERVGVLYNLKEINGKDWYAWSSQLLVDSQNVDGSWYHSHYPGSTPFIDTALALLILKRANLVQDLTQSLQLARPLRDPYQR